MLIDEIIGIIPSTLISVLYPRLPMLLGSGNRRSVLFPAISSISSPWRFKEELSL